MTHHNAVFLRPNRNEQMGIARHAQNEAADWHNRSVEYLERLDSIEARYCQVQSANYARLALCTLTYLVTIA